MLKAQIGGDIGSETGQFNNPLDVKVFPNDDVIVADYRNSRIQVFDCANNKFVCAFATKGKPMYVACDDDYNTVTSTDMFTIEVYNKKQQMLGQFRFEYIAPSLALKCPLVGTYSGKIIICDTNLNVVRTYDFDGTLQLEVKLLPFLAGLGLDIGAITTDAAGNLIVIDTLNHTINCYSSSGEMMELMLYPPNELGAAQSCTVSPEGHIIATEYSLTGEHVVKVFRFIDCACHHNKPGKRPRPAVRSKRTKSEIQLRALNECPHGLRHKHHDTDDSEMCLVCTKFDRSVTFTKIEFV